MSDKSSFEFQPGTDEHLVEQWIAGAKDYVSPSDTLRARILDRAKDFNADKLQERRIGKALIAGAALFWAGMFLSPFFASLQAESPTRSEQIEARARDIYESQAIDFQSATSQAFSEWHQGLTEKLDKSR